MVSPTQGVGDTTPLADNWVQKYLVWSAWLASNGIIGFIAFENFIMKIYKIHFKKIQIMTHMYLHTCDIFSKYNNLVFTLTLNTFKWFWIS